MISLHKPSIKLDNSFAKVWAILGKSAFTAGGLPKWELRFQMWRNMSTPALAPLSIPLAFGYFHCTTKVTYIAVTANLKVSGSVLLVLAVLVVLLEDAFSPAPKRCFFAAHVL